jgi:predicted dehydrogenase
MATEQRAKYRVGVIGAGRKGTQHARAYQLNPLSEVVAIADNDVDNLALFQKRFNLKVGYTDYREMLAKEKLDIVAPILPVQFNPDVVLGCAEADIKAILCEKPMACSLEEGDRMVAACAARSIAFAAGDADRNLGDLWRVRAMIEAGELGEIRSMTLYQSTAEISGGGCQGLSVMRLFAGDAEVEWVSGWVRDDPHSDDDQGMGGYVRFANGRDCFIEFNPGAKRGLEVVCENGVFLFENNCRYRIWKKADMRSGLEEVEEPFSAAKPWGPDHDEEGWVSMATRQADSIQSIIDALEQNIDPRCSGDNMGKVLEIAIGLRESHRRGHVPVQFPLQDRSLKIVPKPGRLLNKKGLFGAERYAQDMQQRRED